MFSKDQQLPDKGQHEESKMKIKKPEKQKLMSASPLFQLSYSDCTYFKTRSNRGPKTKPAKSDYNKGVPDEGTESKLYSTGYDIQDAVIHNGQLMFKGKMIRIPNKELDDWSSLEVCAWLISIDYSGKYSIYVPLLIQNNINGKALRKMTFSALMKLSKHQMCASVCKKMMISIGTLMHITQTSYPQFSTAETPKKRMSECSVSTISEAESDESSSDNMQIMETVDDIDVPLFANGNNSQQFVIKQGRFWRLFYFPQEQMIQYEVDKAVSKWTTYEVSLWIRVCSDGKFQNHAPYIIKHDIDGNHLLNITRNELKNDLKMISPNVRRLFFEELRILSSLEKIKKSQYIHANNPKLERTLTNHKIEALPGLEKEIVETPKKIVDEAVIAEKIVKRIHSTASNKPVIITDLSYLIA